MEFNENDEDSVDKFELYLKEQQERLSKAKTALVSAFSYLKNSALLS